MAHKSYISKNRGEKASDERRDLNAEIAGKIVEALEGDVVPWLQPWSGNARFSGLPRNAKTKRAYSGINVLILWIVAADKGYASSEWLTFKQAKELGAKVRKGEKATQVIYYKPLEFTERNEKGELESKTIPLLRTYYVFNLDQVDDLPKNYSAATQPVTLDRDQISKDYLEAVKKTGADIRYGGNIAAYTPEQDYIKMPKVKQFKDAANYQATLAHELAHWTGHESRLGRIKKGHTADRQTYAFEELVAELSAAFTCAEFGIEGDLRHPAYIKGWVQAIKDDPKVIFRAASRASKATAFLFPDGAEAYDLAEAA